MEEEDKMGCYDCIQDQLLLWLCVESAAESVGADAAGGQNRYV